MHPECTRFLYYSITTHVIYRAARCWCSPCQGKAQPQEELITGHLALVFGKEGKEGSKKGRLFFPILHSFICVHYCRQRELERRISKPDLQAAVRYKIW